MNELIAPAAIGAGTGAISDIANLIGQRRREDRYNKQQERLMDIQQKNQKALQQQGKDLSYELSMDLFNSQSQEAKRKQLEDAGLSVGLMYGGAGAGGTTAASVGTGSAAGGQAAPIQGMDIGNMMDNAIKAAQVGNIKADTKLKDEQASSTYQEGLNKYLANELELWMRDRGEESGMDPVYGSEVRRSKKYGQGTVFEGSIRSTVSEAEADQAEQKVKNMKAEEMKSVMQSIESKTNAALNEAKIELTEEQTRKIYHDILVNYVNAGLKGLDTIVKGRLGSIGLGGKGKGGPTMPAEQVGGLSKHGY